VEWKLWNINDVPGLHAVYNLTVEDVPEYFANNILVHNCVDSARYMIYTYPRLPRTSYRFAHVDGV
jgi:hypothetical protein